MARLFIHLFLFWALLMGGVTPVQAQRRSRQGQALRARPSTARYYRAPVYRDYFKPSHRSAYHYAPSYRAYFNRSPYRPRMRYARRPAVRPAVASARP